MCQILFICKGPSFRKYKPVNIRIYIHSQNHPKRTSADMELRNYPKTLTFIFITTKQKQLFSQLQSMKKQLWHAVIQFFINISFILNFWPATIKNESIHLNSWHHNHKKQKNSQEPQVVLLIFLLELENLRWHAVQRIHQNSKKLQLL